MSPHLCAYPNPGIRFLSVVALALNIVYGFFCSAGRIIGVFFVANIVDLHYLNLCMIKQTTPCQYCTLRKNKNLQINSIIYDYIYKGNLLTKVFAIMTYVFNL